MSDGDSVIGEWAEKFTGNNHAGPLPPHHARCLGCGPENPHGHHLQVWREGDVVRARHVFDERHVGAPGIAHGGAVATVLDDLFGFLLYLIGDPAVTRHLEVGYRAPVMLGTSYLLEAGVQRREGRKLFVRAQGTNEGGAVVVEASALFVVVGLEHFSRGGGDAATVAP
ncbi:PaaI family thioesterase [Modestobacter muralis]|uniref:PaaI family thioesterase n=1 Tax=Modestobacter muralis TaxID=1608614 RepID=UPI001B8CD6F6